jgi:methyl acetate hydrolase
MTRLTRRRAIGTIGAAAVFAAGLKRPAFADAAAGAVGIDKALTEAVNSGRVPGVVALAANDKGTIYSGAFGVRSLTQSQAMTVDSVFWIASMTKAVTTAAAMQMVEQGKLKLDQPASEILPDLASAQVLEGFDAGGKPQLRPVKRPVTLRQLLTHTAGYTYDRYLE